jgi:hypothetical protein
MTNLARRDERQKKLADETIKTRAKRDEALARLVRLETKLRSLEKSERSFRESTKRIRARLLIEQTAAATAKPKRTRPPKPAAPPAEITPAKPIEPDAAKAEQPTWPAFEREKAKKAAALRAELAGERTRKPRARIEAAGQ